MQSRLAQVEDLTAWLPPNKPVDEARAGAMLDAASAVVRSVAQADFAEGVVPDDIQTVVLQVAARAYRNPDGRVQQATGPYSQTLSAEFAAGITLTEWEQSICKRYAGEANKGSRTWVLGVGNMRGREWPPRYRLTNLGGDPVPWPY